MNTLGKTIVVNLLIMFAYVSAQFSFIVEKKTLTKLHLIPLYSGHSQPGSIIFVNGHMNGNGTTTCKYILTLL